MKSEYLIFEKLKSNLVIEKCNDKNIRIYICQIIGRDTDGYGGYEVNSDMVDFIEANFDVKFRKKAFINSFLRKYALL